MHKYLEEEIDEIKQTLNEIRELLGGNSQIMTVKEIAAFYNKPRTSMYSSYRYLLPNFGLSKDGKETIGEWTRKEVIEWNSRPLQERKDELKNMVRAIY